MAFTLAPAGADNTATYDVESSSLLRYRPGIKDNFFQNHVLFDELKKAGSVVYQDGGGGIGVAVEYTNNQTGKAIQYFDTYDTTYAKFSQTAEYKWAQYVINVSISHMQKRQNAGANIYNFAEAQVKNATKSLARLINTDLFAATQAALKVNTLVLTVDATSAIGEINSTSQSFWQANVTTSGSFGSQGKSDMETVMNNCSASNQADSPNLLLSTSAEFTFYKLSLTPQQRYTGNDSVDGSIKSLMFNGARYLWDKLATSGVIYFLNTDAIKLYIDSGTDFIMHDPVRPSNQVAEASAIDVMLQLVTTARFRLGKMTGVTA